MISKHNLRKLSHLYKEFTLNKEIVHEEEFYNFKVLRFIVWNMKESLSCPKESL